MDSCSEQANPAVAHPRASDTTGGHEDAGRGQEASSGYEEEFPAYLELLKDIPPSGTYDLHEGELRHMPEGNKDSGWKNCLTAVNEYDKEVCQIYREQIDTLLVFAGLFSAVVTAFAVESYQWLQDDPLDISVELLRDMVVLLSRNLNVTAPATPSVSSRISAGAVARINTFWFLSLSLSLSAALVGILCKQWLREFERNVGQSPEMALAVRFVRFQGFESWNVGSIVTSVSIFMQMALAFFIIGIVELLWRLHTIVACCVTMVAGLTLAFYLATTFLPVIQYAYICARSCVGPLGGRTYSCEQAFTEAQCAFKSAQAWLAFRILQPAIDYMFNVSSSYMQPHHISLDVRPADSWGAFDINWVKRRELVHVGPRCAFETLSWIAENLSEKHLSTWVWHCVWARWLKNRSTFGARALAALDIECVARSYPHVANLGYNNVPLVRSQALVFRCSLRTDLPVDTAIELLLRVAPQVGVDSRWTADAVHAFSTVFCDLSFRLSDDVAVGLFNLAERQTHAILMQLGGPNSSNQYNGALAFQEIFAIIHRGSLSRDKIMAAMSGLALQWLRAHVPEQIALVARSVFDNMVTHLASSLLSLEDLRKLHGVILVAKLAGVVAELWPEFVRQQYSDNRPRHRRLLLELLAICAEGLPESSQGPGGRLEDTVEEDQSNSPVPGNADESRDAKGRDSTDFGETARTGSDLNRAVPSADSHLAGES